MSSFLKKYYPWFENTIWSLLGLFVFFYGLQYVFDFIKKEELLHFLSYKVFYVIILIEILKIIQLRLIGESHMLLAYHFTLMVSMTFAREVVLLHNLETNIVIGGLISTISLGVMYYLSHILTKESDIKTWYHLKNPCKLQGFFLYFR